MLNRILELVRGFLVRKCLIIISFLLFPSIGFSGEGDVYFCESTRFIDLKDGDVNEYRNQKFKFKRTSNGLVFGSEDGFFKDFKLEDVAFSMGTELFIYGDQRETAFSHEDGTFAYSQLGYQEVISMIGKCSVF
jgi:hypothetical protein